MAKTKRTEEETKELRLKEALTRRPSRWAKVNVTRFEEDIALLQTTVKMYQEKEQVIEEQQERKKQALQALIETYENDFYSYKGEDKEAIRVLFLELILLMSRYVINHRYCSSKECDCSPRSQLRRVIRVHQKEIQEKMIPYNQPLQDFLFSI